MTDAERREQIARDIRDVCAYDVMTQDGLIEATLDDEQCDRITAIILQREAAVLKVAEAAHDMLRDHRFIGEQTQGYRTIEVFGRSLAKLQVALEAWKQGRTP